MPTYKYKATSRDGAPIEGVINAFDRLAALDQIKSGGALVQSIKEVREKASVLDVDIGPKQVNLKTLSIMCSQFSIVLTAGMPITRAVQLMASQTKDKKLHGLLTQVAADVADGYSLADSFENKGSEMLPGTFVETVRAGEESGTLEGSFKNLQLYYEKQYKMKQSVSSAMAYPIFLLVLSVVVIAIVMIVAMPMFESMFGEDGEGMPGLTLFVMNVANFFAKFGILFIALGIGAAIGLKTYGHTDQGAYQFAKLRIKIPIIKDVVMMKASSQFAATMGTLLSAGLPLIRCVSTSGRVLDNAYIGKQLLDMVPKLEEGRGLGECLTDAHCLPEMLVEMSAMGEETGSLEGTLKTIGTFYDGEVTTATARALGTIQPIMTVFLGLIIGVIVIALYLPMFTMYNNM